MPKRTNKFVQGSVVKVADLYLDPECIRRLSDRDPGYLKELFLEVNPF